MLVGSRVLRGSQAFPHVVLMFVLYQTALGDIILGQRVLTFALCQAELGSIVFNQRILKVGLCQTKIGSSSFFYVCRISYVEFVFVEQHSESMIFCWLAVLSMCVGFRMWRLLS